MAAAGENYGKSYSWIASTKNDACTWVADRILHVEEWAQHSDEELLEFAQEFFRRDDGEVAKQNDYG